MRVDLPWPPRHLSPNARVHWAVLARDKAAYRFSCMWLAKVAFCATGEPAFAVPVLVAIHFSPPDNRGRDLDNMLASCKAGLDGVAQAIGVDDKHWHLDLSRGPVVKGGAVILTIGG